MSRCLAPASRARTLRRAPFYVVLCLTALVISLGAVCAEDTPSSDDLDYEAMPEGPGKDEVFGICSACHSMKIVFQQRLSRERWDETLEWMVEERGMAEFDEELTALLLDYLTAHYGPEDEDTSPPGP